MLLTEYDEKKHMRTLYREGYEDGEKAGFDRGEQAGFSRGEQAGFSRGEQDLLARQVLKKLQRGEDAATIADELEADIKFIQEIMDQLSSSGRSV